ncbi:tetratricopeptide repeat protein [Actinomycetospora chiangmaiensis]|uniref:tetratricopeptide repeat protein n=1 Tax=Actinomycetospora chiangmaiensis TaxID=402650 RepID=UPI00036A24BD|nr:hypothetical protein [Actinomycetospora chiangmaiensis]
MSSTDAPDTTPSSEFYLDLALRTVERARELADADERPDLYGVILHDMAELYEATGRESEAVDLYRRSAAAKRRRSATADLLVTLQTLASRLIDRAQFDEARAVTEEAAELIGRSGDMSPATRAGRAFSLGVLYDRLGDSGEEGAHRKALEAFELSLSLYDGDTEPAACANALREVGRLQLLLGHEQDAVESLSEAVQFYEHDGDRDGQVVVLIDLGRLYQRLAEQSASRTLVPAPRVPADDVPPEPPAEGDEDGDGDGDEDVPAVPDASDLDPATTAR